MPTNRITGNKENGIIVLRVARDKEWDLIEVHERFEVPYFEPKTAWEAQNYLAMIEGVGTAVGKLAIERYTKLRHWKFYDERPVKIDVSAAQYDLDVFRSSRSEEINNFTAQDQGSLKTTRGLKAYVLVMWFVAPKIELEVVEPEQSDPEVSDGLVNPYYMPAKYQFKDAK